MPRATAVQGQPARFPLPAELQAIHQRMAALAAANCPVEQGPVFGIGDPAARLTLVGEAPGEREVAEGYPFAGPAGRLLDAVLAEIGLSRAQFWLTNVVKCRPVKEQGGRLTNRAPLAGEIKAWLPLLLEELSVVHPSVLVCLGATSAKALLGGKFRLTEDRGEWREGPLGTRALATFHPAYVLHLEPHNAEASREARDTLRRDLSKVVAVLR